MSVVHGERLDDLAMGTIPIRTGEEFDTEAVRNYLNVILETCLTSR